MYNKRILIIAIATILGGCEFARTKNQIGICLMEVRPNKQKPRPRVKYSKYEQDVRNKFNIRN
jgi:hypothetical protein